MMRCYAGGGRSRGGAYHTSLKKTYLILYLGG
jgi:hypothetical protein